MTYDLDILDFENIRRTLKQLTCTPYGEESISQLAPAPSPQIAYSMQQSVTTARCCVDEKIDLNLGEVPNIRAALRQAASLGSMLSSSALFNIAQILKASKKLSSLIETHKLLFPASMPQMAIPDSLLGKIEKSISDAGRLREDASEKLQQQQSQMQVFKKEAESLINDYCRKNKIIEYLADNGKIRWQNERAVVGVKSENLDEVKGVIKGSQSGGREQLVEPLVALAANNSIERLSQQITTEQQRILRELTESVRQSVDDIQNLLDALAWVDVAFAAGKLSAQMNAHPPKLVDEAHISLNQAYHPMLLIQFLQGKISAPVPLSLTLDKNLPYILITGPNTGGKTVVLKTVGLLQIMAQCGLHIPAEGDCTIGWFDTVMVDMGDRQSMYHQLSTFAGHVEVMKELLNNAGGRSLFLLDELGTGTDPEEGAALAMAMIDRLIESNSFGIVNTHLAPLKPYGEQHSKINHAAMQFDQTTLSPTYELKFGVCGNSFGLVIAQRNGLPEEITRSAGEYLRQIRGEQ